MPDFFKILKGTLYTLYNGLYIMYCLYNTFSFSQLVIVSVKHPHQHVTSLKHIIIIINASSKQYWINKMGPPEFK